MAHQLAERLGILDVDAMLRSLSARQWHDWLAYMELEPRVADALPYVVASVTQAIWNTTVAVNTKKGHTPKLKPLTDFLVLLGDQPKPEARGRRRTPQEQFDSVADALASLGQRVVRDHRK